MPPASVMPPMPTEPVSPKPVASPCSPAATVNAPAVRPAPAQAVRPAASSSNERSAERSITMPPSQTPWPAGLWPPLRTASSAPVSRAWAMTPGDVVGARDAGDESGAAVDVRGEDGPRLVVAVVLRGQDLALEVSGRAGEWRASSEGSFLVRRTRATVANTCALYKSELR